MDRRRTLPPGWVLKECKDYPSLCYYYNESKNISTWTHPEIDPPKIYLQHINIKSSTSISLPPNDPFYLPVSRSDYEAKQLSTEVLQKAKEHPEKFIELAQEYSDFRTGDVGNLGWVRQEQLPKVLQEAVFKLKENEISSVLPSPFGYHIFKRVN